MASEIPANVARFVWAPATGADAYEWQINTGLGDLQIVYYPQASVSWRGPGVEIPFQIHTRSLKLDELNGVVQVSGFSEWSDVHIFKPVPEPAVTLLLGVGILGLVGMRVWRKR